MFCPVDQAHTEPKHFYLKEKELALEQCPVCRGIWVDRQDLDSLTEGHVVTIDTGEPVVSRYASLRCPIDTTPLIAAAELTVGTGGEVRGCPACQGVWFAAGQLRQYIAAKRQLAVSEAEQLPGASLRKFVVGNLLLLVVAAGLALGGFSFSNRVTAEPAAAATGIPTDLKLALWFLVFVELAAWPLVFARNIGRAKRKLRSPWPLSYVWLSVVITTTVITFVITQL